MVVPRFSLVPLRIYYSYLYTNPFRMCFFAPRCFPHAGSTSWPLSPFRDRNTCPSPKEGPCIRHCPHFPHSHFSVFASMGKLTPIFFRQPVQSFHLPQWPISSRGLWGLLPSTLESVSLGAKVRRLKLKVERYFVYLTPKYTHVELECIILIGVSYCPKFNDISNDKGPCDYYVFLIVSF